MSNKIEKIVRHYVGKIMAEMATAMDGVIEEKVNKRVNERLELAVLLEQPASSAPNLYEAVTPRPAPMPTAPSQVINSVPTNSVNNGVIREDIMSRLGVNDGDPYSSIFADTARSNNQIMSDGTPKPGTGDGLPGMSTGAEVPEQILQQAGFLQDFSKHMEAFEEKDKQSVGDPKAEAAYRKAIAKVHGR